MRLEVPLLAATKALGINYRTTIKYYERFGYNGKGSD